MMTSNGYERCGDAAALPGIIGRYLMILKVTDVLDMAIMVFVFYKVLALIRSTRAASLLKGVLIFSRR